MSELKAWTAQEIANSEKNFLMPPIKVYLKSEADKVIAELKEAQRWRKFPDEKPECGKEVLVVDDESKHYIVRFSHDMKWISWGKMNTCESKNVKYWMQLPSAPKAAK